MIGAHRRLRHVIVLWANSEGEVNALLKRLERTKDTAGIRLDQCLNASSSRPNATNTLPFLGPVAFTRVRPDAERYPDETWYRADEYFADPDAAEPQPLARSESGDSHGHASTLASTTHYETDVDAQLPPPDGSGYPSETSPMGSVRTFAPAIAAFMQGSEPGSVGGSDPSHLSTRNTSKDADLLAADTQRSDSPRSTSAFLLS